MAGSALYGKECGSTELAQNYLMNSMKLAEGVGCDLTLILLGHSQKLVKKFAAEPRIQPLKVQPLIADHSPTTTSPSGFTRGPVCAMIEAIPSSRAAAILKP